MILERNHELLDIKIRQYLLPAVSLSMPVLSFIQIPGYFLGNGGAVACGLLLFASSFFAAAPIAHFLSGGGILEADVRSYVFVCLAGTPVLGTGLLLSSFFSGDSHPQLASIYFIISNAVNLILDYVFLKYTPLGVMGAALSTMIGFAVGLIVVIPYIRSPKRMLFFTAPHITLELMKNIATTGMPYLTYLVVVMIKTLMMNSIVLYLLGESGMAVYTVCNNTNLILAMLIGGVIGVIPNIANILYGEKDYYGIHALFHKVIRYGFILTGALMLITMLFTKGFVRLFGITEPALQSTMTAVLRVFLFSMPFNLWNYFGMQYYGSVEKPTLATFITTLENGIFLIPVTLAGIVLGQSVGGNGYMGLAVAFVASEALTVAASLVYRKLKYRGESLLLIPDKNPGVCLDFTIRSDINEAVAVPREIQTFCEKHSVDKSRANLIAVCAEEMVCNTVAYGGEKSKWIDICLTVNEKSEGGAADGQGKLMLRIRDNGIPFDPTAYEYDDAAFEIHGIMLAKKAAKEISYIRAMDLNNTTITI